MDTASILLFVAPLFAGVFAAYNLLHYVLFFLVTHPKDATNIGHQLNEFEERQLVEWTPRVDDFLKHDDENRTYDDVFGPYRNKDANYSTCVFPRTPFTHPYEAECVLLKPRDGMRLLELGCGSGAAAYYLASRYNIEIVCVTNSSVQADICRRTLATFGGRGHVIVTDFDTLDLPSESFDAIYALESIGYTKDVDAWLAGCWRMLKPGGRLLIRSPGSLDHCRREKDYRSVTAFFDNWRYNFLGSNLLVYKARRLGFNPIRYRRLPFWAWGLTWNFIRHMLLWKYRLKMRTFVELEWIIWRTSKGFVFGNAYNTVLATKPASPFRPGTLGWRAVPRHRPRSGRIRALKYRAYSLLQASHATRQDREDPPDQLRGLIQQSPKMGAIHDEQTEIGCRHDRRGAGLPIHQAHLAKTIPRL